MRRVPVFVLSVALVLAGCTDGGDGGEGDAQAASSADEAGRDCGRPDVREERSIERVDGDPVAISLALAGEWSCAETVVIADARNPWAALAAAPLAAALDGPLLVAAPPPPAQAGSEGAGATASGRPRPTASDDPAPAPSEPSPGAVADPVEDAATEGAATAGDSEPLDYLTRASTAGAAPPPPVEPAPAGAVREALGRLAPERVVAVGRVPRATLDAAGGAEVERIDGEDPAELTRAVLDRLDTDRAYVVGPERLEDAMAAVAAAAAEGAALVVGARPRLGGVTAVPVGPPDAAPAVGAGSGNGSEVASSADTPASSGEAAAPASSGDARASSTPGETGSVANDATDGGADDASLLGDPLTIATEAARRAVAAGADRALWVAPAAVDAAGAVAAAAAGGGAVVLTHPLDARRPTAAAATVHELGRDIAPVRVLPGLTGDATWQLANVLDGPALPRGGWTLFPDWRLVALYGKPGSGALGVLGEQGPEAAAQRAAELAAPYEAGEAAVLPTFEIIATLATAPATPENDYSEPTPVEELRPWLDAARAQGIYVVLDLQPGRNDFLTEAQRYEPLLREPDVGLALDPEWRLKPNERHLRQIGSVAVDEVNQVGRWLADLTRGNNLPQKLFLLHQFRLSMLPERERLEYHPELATLIQMDGQGPAGTKYETYAIVADTAQPWWNGWKNFYDEDSPMLSPEQTLAVDPEPWFISYQ